MTTMKDQTTTPMRDGNKLEQPGWEELNCYRVDIYPNKLIVTTTANLEQMREALKSWDPDIEAVNIETVLQRMGHWAVAGCDELDKVVWVGEFEKSDVIVPHGKRYPKGALVVDGYDDQGRLRVFPMGGGFVRAIPEQDWGKFRVVPKTEQNAVKFHCSRYALADSDDLFEGWSDGQLWNGWAKPHFELEEAGRLIAWMGYGRYDSARDAFILPGEDGDDVWAGVKVACDTGETKHVYPIGAGLYCWDEVDQ